MDKKEQLERITGEYLSAFLGFAINKTGNLNEAEELCQEIAFQCVCAVEKNNIKVNFEAFVWSIAYNTLKRWYKRRVPLSLDGEFDTFSNIACGDITIDEQIIRDEAADEIRRALSQLSNEYRKTLVCFYYKELPIREIVEYLSISEGMVKFYLKAGKQKLKEAYTMNNIGEKSFNPSDFSIYKSAIDFSKVNVWEVFKRKLPCQIALICHDGAKSVSEISIETGTPAMYIEDELELLIEAGVMLNPVKNKYRTNLLILQKEALTKIKTFFIPMYETYATLVISAFEKYLPQLKECDVFKREVSNNQWAWFFMKNIIDFDYREQDLTNGDYPQILSCGSRGFIFAEEAKSSPWVAGSTPTELKRAVVWPCDVGIFGEYHRQNELRDTRKAGALYDIFQGAINEEDEYLYSELIKQGYATKVNDILFCNVAVSTEKSRNLFMEINEQLIKTLSPLCKGIRENIGRVVKSVIPEQLRPFTKGYTETWIMFYSGIYLSEILYKKGFIKVPDEKDTTPVACYIYEK